MRKEVRPMMIRPRSLQLTISANRQRWDPMAPWTQARPSLLTRFTASLAVLLVLALTVLSASPELHERLHGHHAAAASQHDGAPAPAADNDDGCVVTLFAQGLVLALGIIALAFAGRALVRSHFGPFDRIAPEAPRYLHLPKQAPPVGLS
jgi:hypothetical protein